MRTLGQFVQLQRLRFEQLTNSLIIFALLLNNNCWYIIVIHSLWVHFFYLFLKRLNVLTQLSVLKFQL